MAYLLDLKMKCPSHDYDGTGYISSDCRTEKYWYHSKCGGKLQLYDNLKLVCNYCRRAEHIKDWRFYCNTQCEYYFLSYLSIANSLTDMQKDKNISLLLKRKVNYLTSLLYDLH